MADLVMKLATPELPLRVAIVGSGPSGFYAAQSLFKADVDVEVHMFEKLPVPYGLVRFGVAPDHGKIRAVIKTYEKIAAEPNYRFWGNVCIGKDLLVTELHEHFDAVIYAFGAQTDRRLDIPGIDLPQSYSATAFCAWYNGHPDFVDHHFDLSGKAAAVIGQGNVAMDVVRVLSRQSTELEATDISTAAHSALAKSKLQTVYCIGRRGPVQAAFTPKELGELGELSDCDIIVNPEDLELDEVSQQELALPSHSSNRRNYEILQELASRPVKPAANGRNRVIFKFFRSPVEVTGPDNVKKITLEKNTLAGEAGQQKAVGTGVQESIDCDVLFRSVGYFGQPLAEVPFDESRGVIPNEKGRVALGDYVVGWIKRGPSGLIGSNKPDSAETVETLLADLAELSPAKIRDDESLEALFVSRQVRTVSSDDWKKIDAAEIARGKAAGKPRDNFTSIAEMLAVLDG